MAVYVTGDVHGTEGLRRRLMRATTHEPMAGPDDYLVVAGDFGCVWEYGELAFDLKSAENVALDRLNRRKGPVVLFVPGNHENYDRLTGLTEPKVLESWLFRAMPRHVKDQLVSGMPRMPWNGGMVRRVRSRILMLENGIFDIGGLRILVAGGAPSHDVQGGILDPAGCESYEDFLQEYARMESSGLPFRVRHMSWWPQEIPDRTAMDALLYLAGGQAVDAVVTHDVPADTRISMGFYGEDPVSAFLYELKERIQYRHWYAGHYHEDVTLPDGTRMLYNDIVRID